MNDTTKRRVQFNLLSILLFICVCAVWIAYGSVYQETRKIEQQLPGLRAIARELIVEDPNQFAVVTRLPTMYGELIWDIYVPDLPDRTVTIEVAMDEIPYRSKDASVMSSLKSARLDPGKHKIELLYQVDEVAKLTVLIDDEPAIEIERAKDWIDSTGHSSDSGVSALSQSYPVDKAISLHRRRFSLQGNANGGSDESDSGIWLWIDTQPRETTQ